MQNTSALLLFHIRLDLLKRARDPLKFVAGSPRHLLKILANGSSAYACVHTKSVTHSHTDTHTCEPMHAHTHTTHTRTSIVDLNRNVDTGEIKVDILAEVVVKLQVQVMYVLRVVITHLLPLHTSITAKYTNSFIRVNMNYPMTHSTFHLVSISPTALSLLHLFPPTPEKA